MIKLFLILTGPSRGCLSLSAATNSIITIHNDTKIQNLCNIYQNHFSHASQALERMKIIFKLARVF